MITLQEAIEKSPIISYFGESNNIFTNCTCFGRAVEVVVVSAVVRYPVVVVVVVHHVVTHHEQFAEFTIQHHSVNMVFPEKKKYLLI